MATGQTGIAIAGWGIAVDHVISDFVAGAAARLVEEGAARAPLLFVEGQGALGHPAYSGVTLGLLHGCRPDVLVLCHRAGATEIDDYPGTPIPPLRRARRDLRARRRLGAPGAGGGDRAQHARARATTPRARRSRARASETGLPADDPCASAARRCWRRSCERAGRRRRPHRAARRLDRARAARSSPTDAPALRDVPRRPVRAVALAALLLARRQPRQGRASAPPRATGRRATG